MGSMSRDKGQRAEREVIDMLQPIVSDTHGKLVQTYSELNFGDCPVLQRNTLQSDSGGCDIAGLEWLSLEVKHHETPQINQWWQQTLRQAGKYKFPTLFYKANRVPWKVRMRLWLPLKGWDGEWVVGDVDPAVFIKYFSARMESELLDAANRSLASERGLRTHS